MITGGSILPPICVLFLCIFLLACGGGDGSSLVITGNIGAEADAFGNIIDSPVSGLRYKSGAHYGITDSDGKYGYIHRETVEFFIGDILIGHAITPIPRLTPYELANSDAQVALNIARFLQTPDNDAIPENGIQINNAVHAPAADTILDFLLIG